MTEDTPTTRTPEAMIRESNHVYAGCFPIRERRDSNASQYTDETDTKIKRRAYKELRSRGIKDQTVITPCNTMEERVEQILRLLELQTTKPGFDKKPWVIVASNEFPALEETLTKLIEKNPKFYKTIVTRPVTIIEKDTSSSRKNSHIKIHGITISTLIFKKPLPAS